MRQQSLFDVEPVPTDARRGEPTADDGLPTLTGSEKQCRWAIKIRSEKMQGVHLLIRQQRRLVETHDAARRAVKAHGARLVLSEMIETAGRLERETTSRFWIDRRELTPEQLLRGVNPNDVEGVESCSGEGMEYR